MPVKPKLKNKKALKPAIKKTSSVKKSVVVKKVVKKSKPVKKSPVIKTKTVKKSTVVKSKSPVKKTTVKKSTKSPAKNKNGGKLKLKPIFAKNNKDVKLKAVAVKVKEQKQKAKPAKPSKELIEAKKNYLKAVHTAGASQEVGLDFDPGFLPSDDVHDEGDQAQQSQLREQAEIQARARFINKPEVHHGFDGIHCVECGIDIPKLRLQMMKVRCVDCQTELEDMQRREASKNSHGGHSGLPWNDD